MIEPTAQAPTNQDLALATHVARLETKRLARQLRTTVRALAALEETCRAYGINFEVESPAQHSHPSTGPRSHSA